MDIVLGNLEHSESRRDFGYYRHIKIEEAMRKMSRGRTTEPDKIPVEFWKSAEKAWIGLLGCLTSFLG